MSSSKQAILMSKFGKKKLETANSAYDGNPQLTTIDTLESDGKDFRGVKDGIKDSGPLPTAKTSEGSSLDFIKASKAGSIGGATPAAKLLGSQPVDSAKQLGEQEVPKTKKLPYSPIKKYLQTGR